MVCRSFGSQCFVVLSVSLVGLLGGCATPRGGSSMDKQAYVREMRDKTLNDFFAAQPDLRNRVNEAAGYGVFSNVNVTLLFISSGHGYGVVKDNATGKETYMRMAGLGAGLGAGLKDFRALFVFPTAAALDKFVTEGWEFGGQAEGAVTAGDKGVAAGGHASAASGGAAAGTGAKAQSASAVPSAAGAIEIYRLTDTGLALHATVDGTKYWRDGELNR